MIETAFEEQEEGRRRRIFDSRCVLLFDSRCLLCSVRCYYFYYYYYGSKHYHNLPQCKPFGGSEQYQVLYGVLHTVRSIPFSVLRTKRVQHALHNISRMANTREENDHQG